MMAVKDGGLQRQGTFVNQQRYAAGIELMRRRPLNISMLD